MSTNQSSNCVESFPLKIDISCIKVIVQSLSAFRQNIEYPYIVLTHPQEVPVVLMGKVIWTVFVICALCQFRAFEGCPYLAWICWHSSSNSLVMSVSLAGLLGSDCLEVICVYMVEVLCLFNVSICGFVSNNVSTQGLS